MQITKATVTPIEIKTREPVRMAGREDIMGITAIFVRLETQDGRVAWGATVVHPELTREDPQVVLEVCQACADMAPDLHPTDTEYSLSMLEPLVERAPSALCAFDLAFHDLLGLAAGMPLYRLMGGYRHRIQTSVTIPLSSVKESVEYARIRADQGFRMLKIKGGVSAKEDVRRVEAIHRMLPDHVLRLDADGGYTVEQALGVAKALEGKLEMLEQPTTCDDLDGLREVTAHSPVPILADQSATRPESAFLLAPGHVVDGISIKMVSCGGLRSAKQMDAIARTAHLTTMVGCLIEPSLLIAAGLSFALSSPNVAYGDLDGFLDLEDDPTRTGFRLEDGWLIASDVPGLGCTLNL